MCQILQVNERQMCGDSTTLIRPNQCHTVTTGQLEASLVTQCLPHSAKDQLGLSHTSFPTINCSGFSLFCPKTASFRLGVCYADVSFEYTISSHKIYLNFFSIPVFDPSGIPASDHCSTIPAVWSAPAPLGLRPWAEVVISISVH